MLEPLPTGAWAFLAVTTAVFTKTLTFQQAFVAFQNDVIWLIVVSFFFAAVRHLTQTPPCCILQLCLWGLCKPQQPDRPYLALVSQEGLTCWLSARPVPSSAAVISQACTLTYRKSPI